MQIKLKKLDARALLPTRGSALAAGADLYALDGVTVPAGETVLVHTGIAVHHGGSVVSGVASARVKFKPLSDEEIYAYIDGGEPMDKAGAYAIQGEGGRFIEGYDGDFDTIMGLSVSLTKTLIDTAVGV